MKNKAALQIITIDEKRSFDYQNQPDFIQKYIFPGGMLPTKRELGEINKKAGLEHFFAERDDPPNSLVTASNSFNAMLKFEY